MNQTQNEAPSLDHLDYETRVRIAVAVCLGAEWSERRHDWLLFPSDDTGPTGGGILLRYTPSLSGNAYRGLSEDAIPDYLNDPAAWGAVMEKERISVRAVDLDYGGRKWIAHAELMDDGEPDERPGPVVCAAVLVKYGRSVSLLPSPV